ncbi:MAG: D-threo-aldose 1-dehydrogenase [Humisphaera sp.]|nr:D-threo-aldose 1-dehydrogenase [Humisphaera sp.]
MRRITLNNTSLQTSPLGFGCVSLTLHDDPAKAVAILNEALDQGVTHFDVARLYGFGQAESMVGEFLRGKRDRVTVTTKFGLQPNESLAKHRRLVSFARKVVHKFPALRKIINRGSGSMMKSGAFGPAEAAASLAKSLAELKTDYIDLYMLHEASLTDARRPDLMEFLEREVQKGTMRHYGVASGYHAMQDDLRLFPPSYRVFQFDHHAGSQNLQRVAGASDRGLVTFGTMQVGKTLIAAAQADAGLARQFGERVGHDLSDPKAIRALLLHEALAANANGIVLFGTTSRAHLRENVAMAGSPTPPSAAQLDAFREFARVATTNPTGVHAAAGARG